MMKHERESRCWGCRKVGHVQARGRVGTENVQSGKDTVQQRQGWDVEEAAPGASRFGLVYITQVNSNEPRKGVDTLIQLEGGDKAVPRPAEDVARAL